MNIIEIIIGILLIAYLVYAVYVVNIAKKDYSKANLNELDLIPSMFTTIGILGTFGGIAYGLWFFNPEDIEKSIPTLLQGLKTAFFASIAGIALSIIFSKRISFVKNKNEKGVLSDETKAINKLIEVIEELRSDFSTADDNGNEIKAGNIFRDIYKESTKQSNALQTFSSDLALNISAGFEEILNNPTKGVVAELKLVQGEIESLGKKLQDPATDMTQNIVKELQESMGKVVEEFKNSMSSDTKNEMEHLAKLLGQAGSSLTDFPMKLQHMTDNLNKNFSGLQEVVKQISQQTISQSENSTNAMKKQAEEMSNFLISTTKNSMEEISETLRNETKNEVEHMAKLLGQAGSSLNNLPIKLGHMTDNLNKNFIELQGVVKQISQQTLSQSENSTNAMKKQIEEMSEVLRNKISGLQHAQQLLLTEQSKNTQASEKLLTTFNTSIQNMNGLSVGVTQSIKKLNDAQSALANTVSNFENASQKINSSSSKFGESQILFSKHSNEFLQKNSNTIDEVQKSLVMAKDVSADYAQKFEIIEKGLQDIFAKIAVGLKDYQETVGGSLETYLGKYSNALTETANSLEKVSVKQGDILEELTEQLSKLNARRN